MAVMTLAEFENYMSTVPARSRAVMYHLSEDELMVTLLHGDNKTVPLPKGDNETAVRALLAQWTAEREAANAA